MKKSTGVIVLCALLCLLGGCGEIKEQENCSKEILTATPWPTVTKRPEQWNSATGQIDLSKEEELLKKREQIIERMEALEKIELSELALYAGKEASLLNSNVLHNLGFLTYDEVGSIYFADRNIGGIFVSDRNGKNRWQLTTDSGQNLQISKEWLYYKSTDTGKIMRIHRETKTSEIVWEQNCEAFLLWKEKLYINGMDGFYEAESDGSNPALLHKQEIMLSDLQIAEDGRWLGTAYNGEDFAFLLEGHLLTYDEAGNARQYIKKGMQDALLAGNWICFRAGKHKVWDMATDTEVELNFYDDTCVSDGTYLYACHGLDERKTVYRFDGVEKKELFQMKSELYARNKYLTPDMLYLMLDSAGGDWLYELWYYDLKTGELGQIY